MVVPYALPDKERSIRNSTALESALLNFTPKGAQVLSEVRLFQIIALQLNIERYWSRKLLLRTEMRSSGVKLLTSLPSTRN